MQNSKFLTVIITVNIFVYCYFLFFDKTLSTMEFFSLRPDYTIVSNQPWTILTCGFVHVNFLHLLFNMLILNYFSPYLRKLYSEKTIGIIYISSIILISICIIYVYNVFDTYQNFKHIHMIGASGGIFAFFAPIYFKYGNIPATFFFIKTELKTILMLNIILSLMMIILDVNTGGGYAHIFGAIIGMIWFYYTPNKIDLQNKKGFSS
jgi:membrane associated rhomboid family serine protease